MVRATEPSRPARPGRRRWCGRSGRREQGLRPGNVIDGNPGLGEAERGEDRCQSGHEGKVRHDVQSARLAGRRGSTRRRRSCHSNSCRTRRRGLDNDAAKDRYARVVDVESLGKGGENFGTFQHVPVIRLPHGGNQHGYAVAQLPHAGHHCTADRIAVVDIGHVLAAPR